MGRRLVLLSVSDRTGLVQFVQHLREFEMEFLSTGGTAQVLRVAGISVTEVADYTGFPEILGGRIKTLHPRVHAGILARHNCPQHQRVLRENNILPIQLVVVNLYPFAQVIQKHDVSVEEVVEAIDIGGPTLVRAAAKNHAHVTVVVDPADYPSLLAEMQENSGQVGAGTRWNLARKAFQYTAAYEALIACYFKPVEGEGEDPPSRLTLNLSRKSQLRYGENPHQKAALYGFQAGSVSGLLAAQKQQGKEVSFNNYLDLDSAWKLCLEFEEPCCAIIKHTNPCGVALGSSPSEAYQGALACDPVSAFGSVIAFNRKVDGKTADHMQSLFVEAVIAPGYSSQAQKILATKKNVRVMEMGEQSRVSREKFDFRSVSGGLLIQEKDRGRIRSQDLKTVTRLAPSDVQTQDLLFAWKVCKHVKSNSIVCAKSSRTLGIGAGQMSRVDSVLLAFRKARLSLEECVMASDAFFPFRDSIDEAAKVGVKVIVQPGGSIRDQEVIDAANEHGIAMVFTGVRHFSH